MIKKYLLIAAFAMNSLFANAQNITLLGHLAYNTTTAGVWHYVDGAGNEYALVGAGDRVSIVDVTNPSAPIEKFNVPALPGQSSEWRELKTFGHYAYAVSEGGGGVIIIDLNNLPNSINSKHWTGDGVITSQLNSAHTIAANDGYLYIFGSNLAGGGCIIADLVDPWNPHYVGNYSQNYIHDGYVRGDTLWAGEIYQGQFSIINIANKANPVLINTQATPGAFCHNTWLSDNGQYLFTTDEQTNAPLGCFDVSNPANISLKNIYICDSLPNEEVHNTRVLNDYLINPTYGSHITIVDASRPENLVEIANAITVTNLNQAFLCWDASPYLPSGNIIATDTYGGLFIYHPVYNRACYLEGNVTDSITHNTIFGATIEILGTTKSTNTDLSGVYKTGIAIAGVYNIRFSHSGYITKTYYGVNLSSGVLTTINTELVPFSVTGQVTDQLSLLGIPNASVSISNGINSYSATCDMNGNFLFSNIVFDTLNTISAGKWDYVTECKTQLLDGGSPVNFQLSAGYMDDFAINNNWTVVSTCSTGAWTRDIPKGTTYASSYANPPADVTNDCGDLCFMTGNGGGSSSTDDVDNGYTSLTSPVFNLSAYNNPYLSYARWFFINPNVSSTASDTLFISLNNGITSAVVEMATLGTTGNGSWVNSSIKISDYLTPTANMTLNIYASDKVGSGNVVEVAFDNFNITEGTTGITNLQTNAKTFSVYPNPFGNAITINLNAEMLTPQTTVEIIDITGRIIFSTQLAASKSTFELPLTPVKGIYFVRIMNAKSTLEPQKIIRE